MRGFLDAIASADSNAFSRPSRTLDLRDYVERAVRGGFPGLVLEHGARMRDVWVDSYLEQRLTSDGHLLVANRAQYKLARYFESVASNSAGLAEHKTLHDAAGIDRQTADTYDELLGRLFIAEQIPARTSRHLDRLIKAPKP